MNQDLKPFYETAHIIYKELLTGDKIPYKKVFNPSILHKNQFDSLLNVLIKLAFIINKINIETLTGAGIDKGKSFEKYKNWMPNETSVLSPNRNEYFLLYLKYNRLNVKQYNLAYKPNPSCS